MKSFRSSLLCFLVSVVALTGCQRAIKVNFATSSVPQSVEAVVPSIALVDEQTYAWLSWVPFVLVDVASACTEARGERARCLTLEAAMAEAITRTGRRVLRASLAEDGDELGRVQAEGLVVRASMPTRAWLDTTQPPAFRPAEDLDAVELDAAGRCLAVVGEALARLKTRYELTALVAWEHGTDRRVLFRSTERVRGEAALHVANVRVFYEHRTAHGAMPAFGEAGRAASSVAGRKSRHEDEETDFATRSLSAMGAGMITLLADGIRNRRDFCTVERLPTPSHESDRQLLEALDRALAERTAARLPPLR